MCTVSLLPRAVLTAPTVGSEASVLRVVCSRDEQRARPAAIRPVSQVIGERRVVMPIDPVGGGTWIAVNDHGLVFALLNKYASPSPTAVVARTEASVTAPVESRGRIIPALAASGSVADALTLAQTLDPTRYNAFRLLVTDGEQLLDCWPEGGRLRHRRSLLLGPVMRTSSAVGDVIADGPRRALFRHMLSGARDPRVAQDVFHRHQWPGREHISVRMARADAVTVSVTVIDVRPEVASMIYSAAGQYSVVRVPVVSTLDTPRLAMCS